MRVLVAGPYGGLNYGDELILHCIKESLQRAGHIPVAMSSNVAHTESAHGMRAIGAIDLRRGDLRGLRQVRSFDALVIGGGEQLHEGRLGNFLWGPLPTVAHLVRSAASQGIPSMLWAVGVDTIHNPVNRWMVGKWVSRATSATVRDRDSLNRLLQMGFPPGRLSLAADPVLALPRADRARSRDRVLDDLDIPAGRRLILVSPSNDLRSGLGYLSPMMHGLGRAALRADAVVVTYLMDRQRSYDLRLLERPELRTAQVIATDAFDVNRIQALFSAADLVVASRMHALILAATQGTPFVNIARSVKMRAFADQIGAPYISTGDVTASRIEQIATEVLSRARDLNARNDSLTKLVALAQLSANAFEELQVGG